MEEGIEDEYYEDVGADSDLREPYRLPVEFVKGLHERDAPPLPPVPVIAFINARSGGQAGPELTVALRRALGISQVLTAHCVAYSAQRRSCTLLYAT